MPRTGHKQTKQHRRRIADALTGQHHTPHHNARIADGMRLRHQHITFALAQYKAPAHLKMKGTHPHQRPDPLPTPIPPSASPITSGHLQRWAAYSHNADGAYYFKREQAETLPDLQQSLRLLAISGALWTYVKSAAPEHHAELLMPIRLPDTVIASLGARFAPYIPPRLPKRIRKTRAR